MNKLHQSIHQKQTQELSLKPKMLQSLNMLALPILELDLYLKNELINNPMLEIRETEDESEEVVLPEKEEKEELEDVEIKKTIEEANELSEVLDYWNEVNATGRSSSKSAEDDFNPISLVKSNDGKKNEYIRQVDHLPLSELEKEFALDLIDSTNSYGFLTGDDVIENLAEDYHFDLATCEKIHKLVLSLEPKGITARNMVECLLSQLTPNQLKNNILVNIIKNDFEDLIHRRYQKLISKYKISEKEFNRYKEIISKLDPKPGLRILEDDTDYIVPDVIIKKMEEKYIVLVNDKFIPNISLSRRYQNIIKNLKTDREAINYVRNKINSAKFLVKSLYMRTRTLEKVVYSIIKHQKKFFYSDLRIMEPLTYSVIAEELQVNESTISRVVKNKYADTPFGLMQLRDFFTSSAGKDKNYESVSRQQVQLAIRELVNNEDKRNPVSDQEIVGILQQRGIKVSRRVIAKYREALGILNSRLRRINE